MSSGKTDRSFDMLHILADENRLAILTLLGKNRELCARDILAGLNISQPTLSHHMSVLLENHLVEARKSGRWVFYRISNESILELISFFQGLTGEDISGNDEEKAASTTYFRPNRRKPPIRKESVPVVEWKAEAETDAEDMERAEPFEETETLTPTEVSGFLETPKKNKKVKKKKSEKDKEKKNSKKKKKKGKKELL